MLDEFDPDAKVKVRNANPIVYKTMRSGSMFSLDAVKRLKGLRIHRNW
ncbi:MAG: hypothetical protein ACR2OR_10610 [Hyphomicrobiales bacterium]